MICVSKWRCIRHEATKFSKLNCVHKKVHFIYVLPTEIILKQLFASGFSDYGNNHFTLGKSLLKCHCNEKIFDQILDTTEQHFHASLHDVFSFSISCLVLEILSFFETCKLGVSDVIYSRIINYIYQMVNISVNRGQKFFKLCMTVAIW